MMGEIEQRVLTQLFVGCVITPDIRIALNQSKAWRQAKIDISDELKEQRHLNKDYLGLFVAGETVTLAQVNEAEKCVRERLHHYCSEVNSDTISVHVLSILLIA